MGFAPRRPDVGKQEDLEITTAAYGASLNYGYGTTRYDDTVCIFAEPLREVKIKRRSKGGKYSEYTYYGTFAVAVCDHEVEKITRIWFDRKLVYDITNSGPVTAITRRTGSGKHVGTGTGGVSTYARFYLGTETQDPDPRMEAILDERIGVGSAPAYRGLTYIFFDDLPLHAFGNHLPAVTVETVTAAEEAFPFETKVKTSTLGALTGFSYSPDGDRFVYSYDSHYEMWDAVGRVQLASGTLAGSVRAAPLGLAPFNTALYGLDSTGDNLMSWPADGVGGQLTVSALTYQGTGVVGFTMPSGALVVGVISAITFPTYYAAQLYNINLSVMQETDALGAVPGEEAVSDYCQTTAGAVYAVSHRYEVLGSPTYTTATLTRLTSEGSTADTITLTGLPANSAFNRVHAMHVDGAFLVAYAGTDLYLIDDQTGAELAHRALSHSDDVGKQLRAAVPGAASIWLDNGSTTSAMEISTSDLTTLRTVDLTDYFPGTAASTIIYNEATNALIGAPILSTALTWYYLDRASGLGVQLADIVDDVSERSGFQSGDWDAADLDQTVLGYAWTQGKGAEILKTLLEVYDSEVGPHDFSIRFRKRGAAVLGTLATADLAGTPRYSVEEPHDDDLPVIASLSFADPAIDGQNNTARDRRPLSTSDGRKEASLSLPTWRSDVTTARRAIVGWMRREWFSSEKVEAGSTRKHTAWEPGDAYTLVLDDISRSMKITRLEFGGNGILRAEWQRYDPAIHIASDLIGAPADGVPPAVIAVPSYTKGLVLDIPLIQDADDGLIVYLAAAPYNPDQPWLGAEFYVSDDNVTYEPDFGSVSSADAAVMGVTSDALPDALTTVIDHASTVTVVLHDGVLTSCTEAEMLDGENHILIGDEVLGFTTASLTAPKTYELSGFLRGRRGTEWATGTHLAGDRVVLLKTVLPKVTMGASEVGDTDYYQPVTSGGSSGFTQALTFAGVSLKPYSPAQLAANDNAGDLVLTWTRRTRIGGDNVYGATPPLGETTEEYVVRIYDGSDVLLRTYSSLTTPVATYTAADQTSDGNAGASWDVRQVSSVVGPGYAAAASL